MSESIPGPSLTPKEQAAIRKLIDKIDPQEFGDQDTIIDRVNRAGQEWARRGEQMNTLANQLVDLTEQIEELSAALENDSYESLTREQKRLRVKRLVQEQAKQNGGRGSVDYAQIRAAFENKCSAGSAHYLMEQVADQEGYHLDERDGKNNLLKVDLSETEEALFSSE